MESGAFNPFLRIFDKELTEENREAIRLSLVRTLMDAERAFLLIDNYPLPEIREILSNILYLGLPNTAQKILNETVKGESVQNEKPI